MDAAQLVELLSSMREASDAGAPHPPGVMVQVCNPRIQEVEAGEPEAQGYP